MAFGKIHLTARIAACSKSIVINLGFKQMLFIGHKFNIVRLKIDMYVGPFLSGNKVC